MAIHKKPKPPTEPIGTNTEVQSNSVHSNEVVKPVISENPIATEKNNILIKNLLSYTELLSVIAKYPGAQVFDERDQANGYLWVRQAGGVDNANPKLVKWLGEHKFLLKAEKGWFLPLI